MYDLSEMFFTKKDNCFKEALEFYDSDNEGVCGCYPECFHPIYQVLHNEFEHPISKVFTKTNKNSFTLLMKTYNQTLEADIKHIVAIRCFFAESVREIWP